MVKLRRTQVGLFDEEECVLPEQLYNAFMEYSNGESEGLEEILLPIESGVKHLKKIIVKDSAVAALCHGADLGTVGISKLQKGIDEGENVALLSLKGELVAIGEALIPSEKMVDGKDTAVDLSRVFMQKEVYPKKW